MEAFYLFIVFSEGAEGRFGDAIFIATFIYLCLKFGDYVLFVSE